MIEAAIMLPVFILLFLTINYFAVRTLSLANAAMGVRFACWMSVKGKSEKDIKTKTAKLFWDGRDKQFELKFYKDSLSSGISVIDEILKFIPVGYLQGNPRVTVQYKQKKFPFAPPGLVGEKQNSRDMSSFMFKEQENAIITCARAKSDTWKSVWDLFKNLIPNV